MGVATSCVKWLAQVGALLVRFGGTLSGSGSRGARIQTSCAVVAFYRVDGGGHTWPEALVWMPPHMGRVSGSLDATRVSWEFLSAHRRDG